MPRSTPTAQGTSSSTDCILRNPRCRDTSPCWYSCRYAGHRHPSRGRSRDGDTRNLEQQFVCLQTPIVQGRVAHGLPRSTAKTACLNSYARATPARRNARGNSHGNLTCDQCARKYICVYILTCLHGMMTICLAYKNDKAICQYPASLMLLSNCLSAVSFFYCTCICGQKALRPSLNYACAT